MILQMNTVQHLMVFSDTKCVDLMLIAQSSESSGPNRNTCILWIGWLERSVTVVNIVHRIFMLIGTAETRKFCFGVKVSLLLEWEEESFSCKYLSHISDQSDRLFHYRHGFVFYRYWVWIPSRTSCMIFFLSFAMEWRLFSRNRYR